MGQQGQFSAPVLGYVYDPGARAIRSIFGVPGSAGLGDAIATDLDRTFVSPRGDYALSYGLRLLRWSGRELSQGSLDSAGRQPDDVGFSHSGEVAAVYYSDPGIVEVWASLPGSPRLAFRKRTEPRLRALAVSDDASAVLGAEETGALILITAGTERLIVTGEYTAVAFLGGGLDAVAADVAADHVLVLRNLAVSSVLAGPSDGVAGPVALGISADNRKLVVANSRPQSLVQIELESRQVSKMTCDCKPGFMQRLRGNAVFLITDTFKTKPFFLDGDAPDPRIFLAPGGTQ